MEAQAKVFSSRVYRVTVDIDIEKELKGIKRQFTFSYNERGTIWCINFEITPDKSIITFSAEQDPSRNKLETYRVICSILNYQEFGSITHQGHSTPNGVKSTDFFDWKVVKKIQENRDNNMQVCFDFIDMSRVCNHIGVNNCAIKQLRMLPFFESGEYTDFLIKTKKKDFKVHKIALAARSPVFDAMFRSQMKESRMGMVSIRNVRTVVMEELLRFMYADVTTRLSEMPCELFAAAHLYDIEDLQQICIEHMSTHMCIENVTGILNLCDRYELEEPKQSALRFVRENEDAILKREEYLKHLTQTVRIDNVVDRLKLAQKFELVELKVCLLEFIVKNYKDVLKNEDYRNMYFDGSWVNTIVEIDEYISNYNDKVNTDRLDLIQNSRKNSIIGPILILLLIFFSTYFVLSDAMDRATKNCYLF